MAPPILYDSLAIVQGGYDSAASGEAVDLDTRFGRL